MTQYIPAVLAGGSETGSRRCLGWPFLRAWSWTFQIVPSPSLITESIVISCAGQGKDSKGNMHRAWPVPSSSQQKWNPSSDGWDGEQQQRGAGHDSVLALLSPSRGTSVCSSSWQSNFCTWCFTCRNLSTSQLKRPDRSPGLWRGRWPPNCSLTWAPLAPPDLSTKEYSVNVVLAPKSWRKWTSVVFLALRLDFILFQFNIYVGISVYVYRALWEEDMEEQCTLAVFVWQKEVARRQSRKEEAYDVTLWLLLDFEPLTSIIYSKVKSIKIYK